MIKTLAVLGCIQLSEREEKGTSLPLYNLNRKVTNVVERSNDWIDQAEGDLEHAKNDLKCGFYDWACFSEIGG